MARVPETPNNALKKSLALAMRRLRYLSRKHPTSSPESMKGWTPAVSREIQEYIKVLRGANRDHQDEINKLVSKYITMDTERLKDVLKREHAKAEEGKDLGQPTSPATSDD